MTASILSDATPTARVRWRGDRLAGVAGIVFVAGVLFQNIVHAAIEPAADASGATILSSLDGHRGLIEFVFALFVVEMAALLIFVGAVYRRAIDAPSGWLARTGLLGVAGIVACFTATVAIEAALTGTQTLTSAPHVVEGLWAVHMAFFTLNFTAIGVALFGLSLATAATGLVPRWFRIVGPIGAALLVIGAMPVVPAVQGSMAGMGIALPGFVIWLAWMLFASAGILRDTPKAEPAP